MTVWAALDGHEFDLVALARHFPTGNPRVVLNDEGAFLVSDELDDAFGQPGLAGAAEEQLARLNGWATLADAGYRHVRLRDAFHREGTPQAHHVFAYDEARARDSVTVVSVLAELRASATVTATATADDGEVIPSPPPEGPTHLARRNRDVDDLLAIVGKADALSWSQLYKCFEIIRNALGGGDDGLVATSWTSRATLRAFTGSANHHGVSGIHDARHARLPGRSPTRAMTLDEAQAYIRDLVRNWLRSLP